VLGSSWGWWRSIRDLVIALDSGLAPSILFEWNGTNATQLSGNPLPGPSISTNATNPELNVVSSSIAPTQNTINITADDMTNGAAIWWANPTVPFADMKKIELRFTRPQPCVDPMSTEEVSIGIVYAGYETTEHVLVQRLRFIGDGAGNIETYLEVFGFDPTGPTVVSLFSKQISFTAGQVYRLVSDLQVSRDDTVYAGPPGVPTGTIDLTLSSWFVPPTTGTTNPDGGFVLLNSFVFPLGASWATTACNKVGIIMGGNWTNGASGAQTSQIFQFKIS